MWNIKDLSLVQMLLERLKFQRGGQNDRQDKNNMPPIFDLRSIKTYFMDKLTKLIHAMIIFWHLSILIKVTQFCFWNMFHNCFYLSSLKMPSSVVKDFSLLLDFAEILQQLISTKLLFFYTEWSNLWWIYMNI